MTPEERELFISDIAQAVRIRNTDAGLSDDEQRWVRLAIKREAQSIEFRKAVIEKTTAGLVWSFIVGMGIVVLEYLRNHGLKI